MSEKSRKSQETLKQMISGNPAIYINRNRNILTTIKRLLFRKHYTLYMQHVQTAGLQNTKFQLGGESKMVPITKNSKPLNSTF